MLPKAKSSQTLSKQQFTIDISKSKLIFLNNKPVVFDQLEGELAALVSGVDEATVVLRVDNSLVIQDLVDILEIGNRLKVKMVIYKPLKFYLRLSLL